MMNLKNFVKPTQKELFEMLSKMYNGKSIICPNSYILVEGDAPVMLLAHLDTVHKEPVKTICTSSNGNILMSPQGIGGDDRCGVYALVSVYKQSKVKPWLLFTCDEEIGCVGASAFCKDYADFKLPRLDKLKFLIEIDRKGSNDAVYYDCANYDFEDYITNKGFKTDYGSCSDISLVAPEIGVAAVNLSSGYYNAHTQHEYIVLSQINDVISRVVKIVEESINPNVPKFEYMERSHSYFSGLIGDSFSYEDLDLENILKNVPENIREYYAILLDYYTESELESFRTEYGDRCIPMMFESEFGSLAEYKEAFGDDWENYYGNYGGEITDAYGNV